MEEKIRVALTNELQDSQGNFVAPPPGLERLEEMPNVEFEILSEYHSTVLPQEVAGFDVVVTSTTYWTRDSVNTSDRPILVQRWGAGFERIDLAAMTDADIMVCNAPRGVRRPMATAIMTLLLSLTTSLFAKDRLIRQGRWEEGQFLAEGLTGKTLGSIGVGSIGHELFRLAKPFEMRHIAYDPYVKQDDLLDVDVSLVDLDTVLRESDILSISAPLTKETYHIVSARELAKMKHTAYLINTARGPLVDQAALTKALQDGTIRGAGLDVFEDEPIAPDDPLLSLDCVVLGPHSIGKTKEAFSGIWSEICEHIEQLAQGEIPHSVVNKEVLDKPSFRARFESLRNTILRP